MILHPALSIRRARIIVNTRINTLRVDTLPIPRTITIGNTSNNDTPTKRISSIPAQTSTLRLIPINVTFSIDSARILNQARVDAVSVDAGFSRVAFRVGATADSVASDVGIAFEAFFTRADRAVVLDEAGAVGAAIAWVATEAVDACFGGRTVGVGGTAGGDRDDDGVAFAVVIWYLGKNEL